MKKFFLDQFDMMKNSFSKKVDELTNQLNDFKLIQEEKFMN